MIDLREIRETIDDIKRNGTTVAQAKTLALLYIAADHMEREEAERMTFAEMESGYSEAAAPAGGGERIGVEAKSKFLEACNGGKVEDVLKVIDEHMDAIRVLYPKEYDAVCAKIKEA